MTYLFPYSEIEKGERVIIYGAGRVGWDYYQQLRVSGYCELLFITDRYYNKLDVENPQRISMLNDNAYDKVIIAIFAKSLAAQASNYLTSLGVPQDKIFIPETFPMVPATTLTIEQFLAQAIEPELERLFMVADGDPMYFMPFFEAVKAYPSDKAVLKARFWELLHSGLSVEERLVLLVVMYKAELLDSDLMRLLVKLIGELEDTNTKYLLAMDIEHIVFQYPQHLHSGYYIDRRKLLDSLVLEYALVVPPVSECISKRFKVCIITNVFAAGTESSPTKLVAMIANALSGKGCKILILPLDANKSQNSSLIKQLFRASQPAHYYAEENRALLNNDIEISNIDAGTIKQHLQTALDTIFGFSPDVILDCSDNFSAVSSVYSKYFPTILQPMRDAVNSLHFQKIICFDPQKALKDNEKYGSIRACDILKAPVIIEPIPHNRMYLREKFDFKRSDFIMVTVGFRLRFELNAKFTDTVCSAIRQHPRMKWLLIGDPLLDYIKVTYADLIETGKIVIRGYEEDLPALYRMCDIFLNPDRVGGGFSITTAIACGLPVATLASADAGVSFAGSELAVAGDYNDLMEYVIQLYNDETYYKQIVRETNKRTDGHSIENYAEYLAGEMKKLKSDWDRGLYRQ